MVVEDAGSRLVGATVVAMPVSIVAGPLPGWRVTMLLLALLCCLLSSETSAQAPERWSSAGSTLLRDQQGAGYVFKVDMPSAAEAQQGVRTGDVMLEIEATGRALAGLAYAYAAGCPRESYEVSGNLSSDEQSIELTGRRPVRDTGCVSRSFANETIVLSKLAAAPANPPPPPVQPPSPAPAIATPSFSCSGQLTPGEAAICSDPVLADLDRQLSVVYKRLRTQLDPARSLRLRDDERLWLAQRATCGSDRNCLALAFRLRLSQLANLH